MHALLSKCRCHDLVHSLRRRWQPSPKRSGVLSSPDTAGSEEPNGGYFVRPLANPAPPPASAIQKADVRIKDRLKPLWSLNSIARWLVLCRCAANAHSVSVPRFRPNWSERDPGDLS